MNQAARGFTLMEVLIALAVFGLVMVGIAQGLQFGLQAWDMQARRAAEADALEASGRVLRGLVARMDPGSAATPPRIDGSRTQLAFTTTLPQGAGAADVTLFVDPAHQLVLRWAPHLHAVRAGPPAMTDTVLQTGLSGVAFAYLDGGIWAETWSKRALPRLIRIHLAPVGGRRWPDIVARPAQDRPAQDFPQ